MAVPTLPVPRLTDRQRSRPGCTEQKLQKVDYLSRKKSFSGLDPKVKGVQSRSNWNKQSRVTLQSSLKAMNPQQKAEDKENSEMKSVNSNMLERTAPAVHKTILSPNLCAASEMNRCFEKLHLNEKPDAQAAENTQHVSLTKSFLLKKNIAEKLMAEKVYSGAGLTKKPELVADKLNSEAGLIKKPVLGAYRGKIMQSKINSFRKGSGQQLQNQVDASLFSRNSETQPPSSMALSGAIVQTKNILSKVLEKKPQDKLQPTTVPKHTAKPEAFSSMSANGGKILRSKVMSGKNKNLDAQPTTITRAEPESSSTVAVNGVRTTSVTVSVKPRSRSTSQCRPTARPSSSHSDFLSKPKQAAILGVTKAKTNPPKHSVIGCSDYLNKEKLTSDVLSVRRKTYVFGQAALKTCPVVKQCANVDQTNCVSGTRKSVSSKIAPGASARIITVPFHTKSVPEILTAVASRFSMPQESAAERRARLAEWQASKGKVMKRPPMVKVKAQLPGVPKEEPGLFFPESVREDDLHEISIEEEHGALDYTIPNQPEGELQNVLAPQNAGSPKCEIEETMEEEQNNNKEHVESEDNVKQEVKYEGCAANERNMELKQVSVMQKKGKGILKKKINLSRACKKEEHNKDEDEGDQSARRQTKKPDTMTPENKSEGSTVIRFNVRTTPFLQSVKKNMPVQLGDSTFKDLKFLTPVRRSRRIERKSFQLPEMLKDHDPCLSSLGELAELGGEANAYIYRENNALRDYAPTADEKKQEKC